MNLYRFDEVLGDKVVKNPEPEDILHDENPPFRFASHGHWSQTQTKMKAKQLSISIKSRNTWPTVRKRTCS